MKRRQKMTWPRRLWLFVSALWVVLVIEDSLIPAISKPLSFGWGFYILVLLGVAVVPPLIILAVWQLIAWALRAVRSRIYSMNN